MLKVTVVPAQQCIPRGHHCKLVWQGFHKADQPQGFLQESILLGAVLTATMSLGVRDSTEGTTDVGSSSVGAHSDMQAR